MKKETAYLLKLPEETNQIFESYSKALGWNRKQTILKLIFLFKDLFIELKNGKELVMQVRDENTKVVEKEKIASFDLLRVL